LAQKARGGVTVVVEPVRRERAQRFLVERLQLVPHCADAVQRCQRAAVDRAGGQDDPVDLTRRRPAGERVHEVVAVSG
jgi:hypothetical protein